MVDACKVCECEAVDTTNWFFCEAEQEYVCPWCVKEMYKLKDHKENCDVYHCYCIGVDFNK